MNSVIATLRSLPPASLLVLLPFLLVACGGEARDVEQMSAGKGGKKYGGTYSMNILRGSPNALDPVLIDSKHADDIASQIYDKLLDLNDTLGLVPEVASKWTISPDGLIYTFNLRTDITFQDDECFQGGKGRRVTASDVVYSLTRCCDPSTQTKAFWAFNGKVKGAKEYFESVEKGKRIAGVEGFKALDDSTFQIELVAPYAPFIYYFVNSLGSVVPREAVEKYGKEFARHPVGSGPFSFVSWETDNEMVLRRNPRYWGRDAQGNQLPFLSELRFRFVKNDNVQLDEFKAGRLQESFGIPTERFPEVYDTSTGKLQGGYEAYQLQTAPAILTWFFDFNTTKAPFDKADVRRAFNYAIDRDKICRYVLQGSPYAPAVHGTVPPVFIGYPIDSVKGYDYDPAMAKKLLAAAGYPEGKGFPAVTLHIYPEPRLQQVADAVQGMFRESLNIEVAISQIEFNQLQTQAETGQLLFWGARWYGDYPDVETFLNLFNGEVIPASDTMPSYPNSTRYDNPAFNEAFKRAVGTIDYLARVKHYLDAERIAIADAPVIPLFYERHYRLLHSDVRDHPLDAMAHYDMKYVWLDR